MMRLFWQANLRNNESTVVNERDAGKIAGFLI